MKTLVEQDYKDAANLIGCEVAVVKAVRKVESNGAGFITDKEDNLVPRILFEGHVFWRELVKRGINPKDYLEGNASILYPKWTKKFYIGGIAEHTRLDRAVNLVPKGHKLYDKIREAALASASWGLFQIMGFNFKECGFSSVQEFITAMYKDEGEHLKAFIKFCKSKKLDKYLINKNFAKFAYGYNGEDYKVNKYDEKLEAAYNLYK